MTFIKNLPLTRIKIFIAKILYRVVTLFVGNKKRIVERNGIMFEVDPSEGIDLSLLLFGNFQKHVTDNKLINIPKNGVVVDVGANVGIMSLQFAKMANNGIVYAFEPTHYAIEKLKKNISLNPNIGDKIKIVNSFVSQKTSKTPDIIAFSSWKVNGEKEKTMHPVHLGAAKSTEGVESTSLDDFCVQQRLQKIDFIKIDTDGHEYEVFLGAKECIKKFKPAIIFEIGIYVMEEKKISFDFYSNYFGELNYRLLDSKTGTEITIDNYRQHIPLRGTIDILALPR